MDPLTADDNATFEWALRDMYDEANYTGAEEWAGEYRLYMLSKFDVYLDMLIDECVRQEHYERCALIERLRTDVFTGLQKP